MFGVGSLESALLLCRTIHADPTKTLHLPFPLVEKGAEVCSSSLLLLVVLSETRILLVAARSLLHLLRLLPLCWALS